MVGTSSTYSRHVWDEPDFSLVLTVTSSDGQTATDEHYLDVCIACGGQFAPPRLGTTPATRAGTQPGRARVPSPPRTGH